MKRTISIALVLAMLMAMLVGCGSSTSAQTSTDSTATADSGDTTSAAPEETTAIDFPTKDINFVIGFPAGHTSDVGGRMITTTAEKYIDKAIVVTNMEGAGGCLGIQNVANSKADGYTLSYLSDSLNVGYYMGNMTTNYKDFELICQISTEDMFIHVPADAPYDTMEEFIDYIHEHPGEVTIGNGGIGTFTQLAALAIASAIDGDVQHIPLSGSDLYMGPINGDVDAICTSLFNALPYIEDGRMKTLVSTGSERSPYLNNEVPTMSELGYDVVMQKFQGVGAPAGTPEEVCDFLEDLFHKVVEDPDYIEFAEKNAINIQWLGSDELTAIMPSRDALVAQMLDMEPIA